MTIRRCRRLEDDGARRLWWNSVCDHCCRRRTFRRTPLDNGTWFLSCSHVGQLGNRGRNHVVGSLSIPASCPSPDVRGVRDRPPPCGRKSPRCSRERWSRRGSAGRFGPDRSRHSACRSNDHSLQDCGSRTSRCKAGRLHSRSLTRVTGPQQRRRVTCASS